MPTPASDNVLILMPGEVPPAGSEDAIKILLFGSVDARPDGKYDWGGRFIKGLVELSDPFRGILQYRGLRFIVYNSVVPGTDPRAIPSVENPEFVTKFEWVTQAMTDCDIMFCNFLKKSTSRMPLYWFGNAVQSGKLVVRCPDQYLGYGLVQQACAHYGVPLMPGKVGSVLAIVQAMNTISDVFNLKQDRNQLPE